MLGRTVIFSTLLSTLALGMSACATTQPPSTPEPIRPAPVSVTPVAPVLPKGLYIVEGEYESISNSAECLALRTKLMAQCQGLRASSVWSNFIATPEYKTLVQDKDNFHGAGCGQHVGTPAGACAQLQRKIDANGAAIAATPQWKTVETNDIFQSLRDHFDKAKKIECIK